ncbi:MAG: phage tail protein [Clostridia bacterium]|nr:phage tail protein [Clostridia bacterium]
MIPVLYGPTEKRFTSRGLGPLPDASMAHIEEVRLGEYELEMEYPVTGLHFDELQYGNVIKARNAYLGEQPFDIYYISKPMSGIVTVRARHISYRLNKKVLTPCSSSSAAGAMSAIETHILDGSDFTFWTDKSTQANWAVTEPKNVRAALGGTEGSILDVFGGEYEWDGFTVKLHGNRGTDNGVSIRFGKNLLDLVAELDASDVVTACVPYYTASDGTCVYGSKVKSSAWSSVNDLVTVMDMKEYFTAPEGAAENWTPTTAAMEETALSLMEQRLVYQATQHLKVDFALLSQSKEYAHLAALERVNLCDYVTVAHPGMGIDVKVKVIKTVWDVLADRYDSIELGEPTARLSETLFKDLNDALNGIQSALDDKVSRTHMDIAIENATNLLTGGTGGHVVIGRNADGEPNEIFIMNTADQSTATSVIRINMNGIGFSSTGINGPFTNAWTIDGHFVADFIDTGTLTGSIIKAGILRDEAGVNYWNMETGEFQLTPAAKIKTGENTFQVLSAYISGITDDIVSELEEDLQEQIDGKIDTFYQSADPSTGWTAAEKTAHTGDLWYKTTDNTTWRWSGTAWQEQEVPAAVFDEIDGKSTIFYGTTSGTYTGVQTGDYLVDSSTGATYRWSGSAWVKQTDYATAITTALADLEEELQEQIDGKIDTFYQSSDPSTNWTADEKAAHAGDLWYKTTDSSTWRWSGSAWQEQSVPDEVFDAIDGKSTIFYGTTSGTYTGVQTGDYLVDSTSGKTYRWNGSSWVIQTDYASAISDAIGDLREDLEAQIEDGKIETFYQSADPSTSWTTAQKSAHTGDLWYKTSDGSTWRWSGTAWQEQSVPDEVFDAIDGKSTIFYGTTSGTYTGVQTGDYLVDSTTGSTYRYTGSAWSKVTDYSTAISNYDTSLNQQAVFNKLTNNGETQGIYLNNNKLYVNASFIATGTLKDASNNTLFNLSTGDFTMGKGSITLGSNASSSNYYFHVSTTGAMQWKSLYSEMTSDGQLACSRMIIMTTPQAVDSFGTFHFDIRGSTMKLVDNDGLDSWAVDPKNGMRFYDFDGYIGGAIRARNAQLYTRNTTGLNLNSSTRIVISSTNGLRFDDGSNGRIRLDNYNGKCGLNQDEYGLALFYNRSSAENCYVRVDPNGQIDLSTPVGANVNGYKIITRDDLIVYSDGTIKWNGS